MGSAWPATGSYFGKMKPRAPGSFLDASGALKPYKNNVAKESKFPAKHKVHRRDARDVG